jgi:diaminohydroxyphosphoribosylaminopyrimidine deaminase/5-amino-6-(5-phosphoribosylamino)uracil reductase
MGGGDFLRAAGLNVSQGLLEPEARAGNEQFLFAQKHRRPFITLKAAASLDGRIALPSGESKWITGPEARAHGHRLRAERGAVLVGRRTVEADDPQLTARIEGVVNQPIRVVLDPNHRLGPDFKVFDSSAPTIHISNPLPLEELVQDLFNWGINGILVEGGAYTISQFVKAGLFDEVALFIGPVLLGDGPSWISGLGFDHLSEAPRLTCTEMMKLGADLFLRFRPQSD